MSRRPYPVLLLLAMSLPGAVRALGLGDIRVGSGLNEPLSAQIDIVGATRDELAALTATVANREIFQRYGADRPAFLSTATFKVGTDAEGKPVLIVRSNEAFTDPVVTFLVDLRLGKSEVVREYSLLLDPPGYGTPPSAPQTALAAILPAASVYAPSSMPTRGAPAAAPDAAHSKVSATGTLRGVAHRAGARTEIQLQRMMIAIFRANPSAFDGNINRMHAHALLTIPSPAEVAAISTPDARREVRAHMAAWRLDGRPAVARRATAIPDAPAMAATPVAAPVAAARGATPPLVSTPPGAQTAAAASTVAPAAALSAEDAALKSRVDSLEQALAAVHQQLAADQTKIQTLKDSVPNAATSAERVQVPIVSRAQAATVTTATVAPMPVTAAPVTPKPVTPTPVTAVAAPTPAHGSTGTGILGGLLVSFAAVAAGFVLVRRRVMPAAAPAGDDGVVQPEPPKEIEAAAPIPAARPGPVPVPMLEAPTASKAPAMREAEPVSMPFADPEEHGFMAPEDHSVMATGQYGLMAPEHHRLTAPEDHRMHPGDTGEHTGTVTSLDLDIDIEALERSYLDSLPNEPAKPAEAMQPIEATARLETFDTADTTTLETQGLGIDATATGRESLDIGSLDMDTAFATQDPHTAIMATRELDHLVTDGAAPNATTLDYDLLDLDATAQHVQMPSELNGRPDSAERRMNIVDVLRAAVERDPQRRDLRMKLLETYYAMAAQNQRAFMEIVRKVSRERDYLTSEDWKKVMKMGREIAADDILFAGDAKDDLADYAA